MSIRLFSTRTDTARRLLALGMALAAIVSIRPAQGDPGDLFTVSAPTVTAGPPTTTPIADGDAGVSSQTGAMTYAYPISIPPGRNGMRPGLSLSYSSQAPIYGTLAAGFSLAGIPMITEDTTSGRLWGTAVSVPQKRYASSMAGGQRLFVVTEPGASGATQYRAHNDSSWVRYERLSTGDYWWRAYSTDGSTFYFGDKDAHTSSCTVVSDGYAPLTRSIDAFGNQIDYIYQAGVDGECRIKAITWGQNSAAGVGYFAAVEFSYAPSPPSCAGVAVGTQTSYRTGVKIVTGASELTSIKIAAFSPLSGPVTATPIPSSPDHTRTITLSYSTTTSSCTAGHAAFRALTKIAESAVGVDSPQVTLPAVDFSYGSAVLTYPAGSSATVPWSQSLGYGPVDNLGWGYRSPDPDVWPTVEAMMLDLDGDGLIDRLVNDPEQTADPTQDRFCQARWYRNTGDNFFEDKGVIKMPTLKWGTPAVGSTAATQYCGGAYARTDSTGAKERCALNYQRTAYRNANSNSCAPLGASCPTTGYCSATNTDCSPAKIGAFGDTVFAWRWFDIDGDAKPDLIGSPMKGGSKSYDLQWGTGFGSTFGQAPPEPAIFGVFPSCPSPPYTSSNNPASDPYTMCGGMFPWFVFLNKGNGVFGKSRGGNETGVNVGNPPPVSTGGGSTCEQNINHANWGNLPDTILYQPIPLETAAADSSILSRPVGEVQGTVDIDGDGHADAVRRTSASTWSVFRNDGKTGRLEPAVGSTPFFFATGTNYSLFRSELFSTGTPRGVEGLTDFNGDGLADHWSGSAGSTTASVHFNNGVAFLSTSVTATRPGTDATPAWGVGDASGGFVCRGSRKDARRPIDADGDGRVDIASLNASGVAQVEFNQGGVFGSATTMGSGSNVLDHLTLVRTNNASTCSASPIDVYSWHLRSDMIDLDGDSIPEGVSFGGETATGMSISKITTPTQPPRLLVEIKNNRGATTSIAYDSMHGGAVEQHPELGKATPSTAWVVKSITTDDSLSGTSATTTYTYVSPRFHADDQQRYGFRGFDEVHAISESGAKTVDRFSYVPDWSGRLSSRLIMPSATGTSVHAIDDTIWEERALFGGSVKTFHATLHDHWTCKNGQDEAACRANTDTRTRTVTTLAKLTSTKTTDPTELLWQATSGRLQASASPGDGDRVSSTTFALHSDASSYRLRPRRTIRQQQAAGSLTTFAQSETVWDPTFRVPENVDVWSSQPEIPCTAAATEEHCARTHSVFDMDTGNVLQVFKPEQWSAGGVKKTALAYDVRNLFVATSVNEAGHQRDYQYEYGTGTKVRTSGPNVATCSLQVPISCPPNTPFKEDHRIRVDGLGRMIERFETFNSAADSYSSFKVETNAFVDGPAPSMTHQSALDYNQSTLDVQYTQDTTELDGLGRPIRSTAYVFGSAPANQITTFFYRDDGTLREVRVPDPTANDTSVVSYTYEVDSLGRPTGMRRPDTAVLSQRSGADLAYDGLVSTSTEVVGAAGGQAASHRTTTDAFGRVARVEELVAISPSIRWAVTDYRYDPADRVQQIDGPEQVTTTLAHDMAGRRVAITRAGRTWSYGYDRNGNLSTEVTPCSPMPLCAATHVSSIDYDDLDRPISKLIAPRELSASDRSLFGSDTETLTYDVGTNVKGFLQSWQMLGPSATTPTHAGTFSYNAQGQVQYTDHATSVAGYPALARSFLRFYRLSGAVASTYYRDIVGTQSCVNGSYSETEYDRRGAPSSTSVLSCLYAAASPRSALINQRNVAGLVTKRYSANGQGPYTYAESNWSYDKLGRVTSQVVKNGAGLDQVVRQDLSYLGNDDPAQLDHWLGAGNHKTFAFTYDRRHQLVGATEMSTAGYFSAAYQFGDGGRFERVTEATIGAPGSNVVPRDVQYQYLDADRERVTGLVSISSGQPFATYEYDPAGNQIRRCYGPLVFGVCSGESTAYLYDGKDQLRRATKRNAAGIVVGSEEYWYDHAGQRNIVVKRDGTGAKTEMVWFIEDTEAHYDASGTVTRAFGHVTLGTPVARLDRSSDAAATVEYQFHGLASNTIAAVDQATGTINASFSYAPFGEVIEATNAGGASAGTAVHMRRLNDKIEDDLTSLAYYGARYYDKTLIGWTQADPLYLRVPDAAQLSSPRRANIYAFSLNNSLRYMDPDGLDARGPSPGIDSYKSEMETSAAGRAANMASDGGMVGGCEWFSSECGGGASSEGGAVSSNFGDPSDPCNGVTSVCNGPVQRAAPVVARLVRACGRTCEKLVRVSDRAERFADKIARQVNDAVERGAAAVFHGVPVFVRSSRVSSNALGRAGEAAVRTLVDIGPKVRIGVAGRIRIPDGLTNTVLSEVKNVGSLSYTQQLRDFASHASVNGLRFDLWVRPVTQMSPRLMDAIESGAINRRFIP